MKANLAGLGLLFLTGLFFSCNENSGMSKRAGGGDTATIVKPPEALSGKQLQEQIDKEIQEVWTTATDTMVKDAAEVVVETRSAMRYLLDSNYDAATKSIERAIGKAEVITAAKPSLGMVPLELDVNIHDLITDMETLKKIRKDVEDLTDKGYLQAARLLLNDVSSEITISTSSLPLATYPDALKLAVKLTKEKKPLDAALVLNNALNTIVVDVRSIPLPLVRAERMLVAVDTLLNANDVKTDDVNTLLDNAEYQIRFAEALGYGKKDKEFEELYSAIKELKAEAKKKGSNAKKMNTDLRKKLKAFKIRISPREKKTQS